MDVLGRQRLAGGYKLLGRAIDCDTEGNKYWKDRKNCDVHIDTKGSNLNVPLRLRDSSLAGLIYASTSGAIAPIINGTIIRLSPTAAWAHQVIPRTTTPCVYNLTHRARYSATRPRKGLDRTAPSKKKIEPIRSTFFEAVLAAFQATHSDGRLTSPQNLLSSYCFTSRLERSTCL